MLKHLPAQRCFLLTVLEKRKHLFGHLVYVGNVWMKKCISAFFEKQDANFLLSCEIKLQIEGIFPFIPDPFSMIKKWLLLSVRNRCTKASYKYQKILGGQFNLSQHSYCNFVDVILIKEQAVKLLV